MRFVRIRYSSYEGNRVISSCSSYLSLTQSVTTNPTHNPIRNGSGCSTIHASVITNTLVYMGCLTQRYGPWTTNRPWWGISGKARRFRRPMARNAHSPMTPPNTNTPRKLQCVGNSGPVNMIRTINANWVTTNTIESQEWDESPELFNKVTNYPSSLRSTGNLPTKNLSGYNESINLKISRYSSDLYKFSHDSSDRETSNLVS